MLKEKQEELTDKVDEVYGKYAQHSMNRMQAAFGVFGGSLFGAAAAGEPALLLGILPAAASMGGNFFNWLNVGNKNYVDKLRYNTVHGEEMGGVVVSIFGKKLEFNLDEARSHYIVKMTKLATEELFGVFQGVVGKEQIQTSIDSLAGDFNSFRDILIGGYLERQESSLQFLVETLGDYDALFSQQHKDQKGISKFIKRMFLGENKITSMEKVELDLRHLDLIEDCLNYGRIFFDRLSYSDEGLETRRNSCLGYVNTAIERVGQLRERLYTDSKRLNPELSYRPRVSLRPKSDPPYAKREAIEMSAS